MSDRPTSAGPTVAFSTLLAALATAGSLGLAGVSGVPPGTTAPGPASPASPPNREAALARFGKVPLAFEANSGQADARFQFLSRGAGHSIHLGPAETVVAFRDATAAEGGAKDTAGAPLAEPRTRFLQFSLLGANPGAPAQGVQRLPGRVHHIQGADRSRWSVDVPTFAKVRYSDVYPGIDTVFYGNQEQFEYDFVVAPGANPDAIAFRIDGAEGVTVDASGDLVLRAGAGQFRQHKPVVYQEQGGRRRDVPGRFVLEGSNVVRFALGSFDRSLPLVIDPVLSLAYSTYLGSPKTDRAWSVAADASGHLYVAGDTFAPIKVVPTNGFSGGTKYGGDAFVAKLNPEGNSFDYFTYLGGDSLEVANAVTVDAAGSAYVAGFTISAVVYRITNELRTLTCTNFGLTNLVCGANEKVSRQVIIGMNPVVQQVATNVVRKVDNRTTPPTVNDIYTIITTNLIGAGQISVPFPTVNALQDRIRGELIADYGVPNADAFITKLDASGLPVYSTCLGGEGAEVAGAIAVDTNGIAHVTGYTDSALVYRVTNEVRTIVCTNFSFTNLICGAEIVTTNVTTARLLVASETVTNDLGTFTIRIDNSTRTTNGLSSIVTTTLLGAVQLTDGFPVVNGYQTNNAGGADLFVATIAADGATLLYSTYLGGAISQDFGTGIGVDADGNVIVAGVADDVDFPVTNALQSVFGGGRDGILAKFDPTGTQLLFSTYLGGTLTDVAYGLALDSAGNAHVAGSTSSRNFLSTAGHVRPGGISKTLDGGTGWNLSSTGLTHTGVRALALNPASPSTVFAGTPRGVFLTIDGGATWTSASVDLAGIDVTAIAIDPITPANVIAAGSRAFYRSEDAGFSWTQLGFGLTGNEVRTLIVDASDPSTIHAGTRSGYYFSPDRGTNFYATGAGLKNRVINQLVIDPVDGALFYAATDGGVFKSTNSGANWTAFNTGLATRSVRGLAVNPSGTSLLVAGTSKGVYRSTDAGVNWVGVTNGIGRPQINAVVFDPADSTVVYAAATNGVFKSANAGLSWTNVSSGLIARDIVSLAIDPSNTSAIYAGARGTNYSGGTNDAFLVKVAADGQALDYGFTFGGTKTDEARAVAVDTNGYAYVTGLTLSRNFPTFGGTTRWQSTNSGAADAFIACFDPTGSSNVFSILLGGKGNDYGYAIALDGVGGLYVAGATSSKAFPTTNALQSARSDEKSDAFLTKFLLTEPSSAPTNAPAPVVGGGGAGGAILQFELPRGNFIMPPVPGLNLAPTPPIP